MSRHFDCSPWFMMTRLGLGLILLTKDISSFLDECPENPSIDKTCRCIGTISLCPFTSNVTSLAPSLT